MTTQTARANAARKVKEASDRFDLRKKWIALYDANPETDKAEYLSLGGTDSDWNRFVHEYFS